LKTSFLALGIVGALFILFGIVFALQGDGMIGGSSMSGNSFWTYTGSVIAVVGLILAALGFSLGFKARTSSTTNSKGKTQPRNDGCSPVSSSAAQGLSDARFI
jgi:hypothetical protein